MFCLVISDYPIGIFNLIAIISYLKKEKRYRVTNHPAKDINR